jgi:hypothetical protein
LQDANRPAPSPWADARNCEGFEPRDFVVVCNKDEDEVIATYMSEFKGRDYFHVRTIYQEDKTGDWCPGKGFSVPAELAAKLCENIGKIKQKRGGDLP